MVFERPFTRLVFERRFQRRFARLALQRRIARRHILQLGGQVRLKKIDVYGGIMGFVDKDRIRDARVLANRRIDALQRQVDATYRQILLELQQEDVTIGGVMPPPQYSPADQAAGPTN